MKKRITIILTMLAIMILGGFTYYGSSTKTNKETESIVIDTDRKVVELLSSNNTMGH